MIPTDDLESLRRQAKDLEPKLAQFEDALLEMEHLMEGAPFLREQLRIAEAFRITGETPYEKVCYLKAALAFDLLECQVLVHK